jgi:TRAP-type C4-dicarboxylate transport system permease small subunit
MTRIAALTDKALRVAAVLLMLALLACVVIGVVMRLVNQPVAWSDEAAQYLLVWTGFTGWMIASRSRAHIRITVFLDLLPRVARQMAEVVIQLAMIGFALALIHYGFPLIARNWDIEWVSLPLASGLLYVPIPFAAATIIAQALVAIVEVFRSGDSDAEAGSIPL